MSGPGANSGQEKRLNGSDRRQKRKPSGRSGPSANNQPATNNHPPQQKPQNAQTLNSTDSNRNNDRRRHRNDKPSHKNVPQTSQANGSEFSQPEIAATGPLIENPSSLGFKKQNRAPRQKPKYLIPQQKMLIAPPSIQDQWDVENQQKMLAMEARHNGLDNQGLYEELQVMREVERKHMEVAGLVDAENTRKDLNEAILFQGTCQDMCPVFERVRRALENNVKALERDPQTNKISRSRAVKAFSRPAAGQPPPLPSEVRPPLVLKTTLDYLVDNILPQLPEAHSFIWDRTRSIRQDFTYQNYFGPEAIDCNERIVRIHLVSLHIMAGSDTEYSQQQELEQFNKALQTLMEIYQDVRNQGGLAPNEAEFRAYYLLSHIRDPELDREIQSLPHHLMEDPQIQLALMFRNIISQSNVVERGYKNSVGALNLYREFFRLVYDHSVPYLLACLLETHFNVVRFYALKAIARTFHSKGKPYSVSVLADVLGFPSLQALEKFVTHYDIDIFTVQGKRVIDLFNREKLEQSYKLHSINDKAKQAQAFSPQLDSKLTGSIKDVINSGKLNDSLQLKNGAKQNIRTARELPPPKAALDQTNAEPKAGSLADFLRKNGKKTNLAKPAFSFGSLPAIPQTERKLSVQPVKSTLEPPKMPSFTASIPEEDPPETVKSDPVILKPLEDQTHESNISPETLKKAQFQAPIQQSEKTILPNPSTHTIISSTNLVGNRQFPAAAKDVADQLIRECIERELLSSLPAFVNRERTLRARSQLLDTLSKELYDAFMSEVLYNKLLSSIADNHYAKTLRKKILGRIMRRVHEVSHGHQKMRDRRDELNHSSFHKPIKKRVSADSSLQSISTSFVKRRTLQPAQERSMIERREEVKALWQPLDWGVFASRCASNIRTMSGSLSLKFVFVVKDWSSPYSKWLNTKLALKLNQEKNVYEREVRVKKLSLEMTSLPAHEYLTKTFFLNASFILFECGLCTLAQLDVYGSNILDKLSADANTLEKIIQMVDRHTYYKAQILILYWDAGDNAIDIERVKSILQVEKWSKLASIAHILVCDMTAADSDVNSSLISGMQTLASNFDGTLTSRGIRKTAQESRNRSINISAINDSFREQERSQIETARSARKYDYLSNHIRGSNNRPVTSRNSSFAADQTSMIVSRLSGFGQGVADDTTLSGSTKTFVQPNGQSLQQLRDLTASIRQKYQHKQ